jgi:hypothetical protein
MPLLEKEAEVLRKYHPHAQMWVTTQGFDKAWLDEFYAIVAKKPAWLTGVVYGPHTRDDLHATRVAVPRRQPIAAAAPGAWAGNCGRPDAAPDASGLWQAPRFFNRCVLNCSVGWPTLLELGAWMRQLIAVNSLGIVVREGAMIALKSPPSLNLESEVFRRSLDREPFVFIHSLSELDLFEFDSRGIITNSVHFHRDKSHIFQVFRRKPFFQIFFLNVRAGDVQ